MQILEGEYDLSGIESRHVFRVASEGTQMCEHFSTGRVFQTEIEVGVVFERVHEFDDEWARERLEDLLLGQGVIDLFHFDDHLLVENLHRHLLTPVLPMCDQKDTACTPNESEWQVALQLSPSALTERTRSDRAYQLEVFELRILPEWILDSLDEMVFLLLEKGLDITLTAFHTAVALAHGCVRMWRSAGISRAVRRR